MFFSAHNKLEISRILVSLASFFFYFLFIFLFVDKIGGAVFTIAILPIVITAWFLGLIPATLSAFFLYPFSYFFLIFSGHGNHKMTVLTSILGTIGLISIGLIMGYLHQIRDRLEKELTERKKLQLLYETLVNVSPSAMVMFNDKGKITFVSNQALALHKYGNLEEILALEFHKLIVPEDRDKLASDIKKCQEGGCIQNLEYVFLRADGSRFPGLLNIALIKHEKPFFVGFINDLSGVRSAEKQLATHIQELERLNRLMIGREIRMKELKEEINKLKDKS